MYFNIMAYSFIAIMVLKNQITTKLRETTMALASTVCINGGRKIIIKKIILLTCVGGRLMAGDRGSVTPLLITSGSDACSGRRVATGIEQWLTAMAGRGRGITDKAGGGKGVTVEGGGGLVLLDGAVVGGLGHLAIIGSAGLDSMAPHTLPESPYMPTALSMTTAFCRGRRHNSSYADGLGKAVGIEKPSAYLHLCLRQP